MRNTEMIPNVPVSFQRTRRMQKGRVLTSGDAGKILPIKADPLLREESFSGNISVAVEMMETSEKPVNAIIAKAMTYYVPYLAFEQFNGSIDELNRSYSKENGIAGSQVDFFEKNKYYNGSSVVTDSTPTDMDTGDNGRAEFYGTMGIHHGAADMNNSYVQAYNAIVNHRRKARSTSLAVRNEFEHDLAEAFWPNEGNSHIMADFDQKLIDGEVALNGLTFKAPIRANGGAELFNHTGAVQNQNIQHNSTYPSGARLNDSTVRFVPGTPLSGLTYGSDSSGMWTEFNEIWAELTDGSTFGGATMSLADIEQARKTAAFAKLRSAYDGIDEEYIIDLLMQGITVPEEMMKQPMLIGQSSGMFGFAQRFATDSGNLDDTATNGFVQLGHSARAPRSSCGGIIMTTLEIAPERVWERKKDYFLYTTDTDNLPNALRDSLDPEKVAVVKKNHLDVNHSTPDATLGYAPLNHEYNRDQILVGGKFYRPVNDAFTEVRSRIWTNETTDPSLSTDFYLCTNLHKKIFADQVSDSFEITAVSDGTVDTNVVFGDRLIEADATSDYETITNLVDANRITK
jgi:hypothetical protein